MTILDIADKAGVSGSTVSRALRDHPSVRPEVRRRVHEVAKKLGYQRNPLVTALMQQIRTGRKPSSIGNLAFLNWSTKREDFQNIPVVRRFWAGALEAATAEGYHMEQFFPIADTLNKNSLMRILKARGMLGVVMQTYVTQDPSTREIMAETADASHLPIELDALTSALVGGKFHRASPHFVQTDQYAAGQSVAEELLKRGYRRPGLVMSSFVDAVTDHRFHAGIHSVWSRHGKASDLRSLVLVETELAHAPEWVRKEKVDVVICFTSDLLEHLLLAKIKVPMEIGFISLDVTTGAAVSGIDQRHEEVGAAAVKLVIDQLNRGERGLPPVANGVLVEGIWNEGTTIKPKPSGA